MFLRPIAPWALLILLLFGTGCASARYLVRPDPTNAEEAYQQAMEDLEGGLYPEAIAAFADLKAKYPYTKYAALADLRTADTEFERAKYADAIDAYRNFLKFHPNHGEAPYAMVRIAESYFEQIPEDWFFLPPAAEKDQANTKLALGAYKDAIRRFPKAEAVELARTRIDECRAKLAEHEMYVAKFYFDRERYLAAAGRAEGLLESYDGLGFDEEALWIAGYSRFQIGELEEASGHLEDLREAFPEGSWSGDAADLLRQIAPQLEALEEKETQDS